MRSKFHIAMLACCAVILCAASALATWKDSSSHFSCSGYFGSEKIGFKGNAPLAVPPLAWPDTCAHLKEWVSINPQDEAIARMQYDTVRLYIEKCAVSDTYSWRAFTNLISAVQFMSNDTTRFDSARTWLVSVLYLNTKQPEYFCACMGAIQHTYQYGKNKGTGTFAVEDYLRKHHPECFSTDSASIARLNKQYTQDSLSLVRAGMDPVHLPPLDSIGLGIVLQHDANLDVSLPSNFNSIKDISLQPNPALESVTASYTLNSQSFVILSLFDALGKTVWEQTGRTEPQGEHNVSIDLHTLPSGTYYLRIRTLGETKTVTLVHEK